MAFGDERVLLKGIRGKIGKQLVIKQYADKIVIARYPSMPTRKQVSPKKGETKTSLKMPSIMQS